jgi:UDP-N-acetylmuramate--alanine ligase
VEGGHASSHHIRVESGYFVFDYTGPQGSMEGLRFPLPGRHNVENATVAISIALSLGVSRDAIREGLLSFRGVKRRFELIYRDAKTAFFDDYAHHPTELEAAIRAARELFPDAVITGVFQPHLYSRTQDFADGFAAALDLLDIPFVLDIYPARELPIPGVDSAMILARMKNPKKQACSKETLLATLRASRPKVLLTLGAGDIDTLVDPIAAWLSGQHEKPKDDRSRNTHELETPRLVRSVADWRYADNLCSGISEVESYSGSRCRNRAT